jgi:hypothetical protein
LPEEKIDPEMRARIDAVELHDLAAIGANSGGAGTGGLIDPRIADELGARLKALPRIDMNAFLNEFDIDRVRDLRASQESDAKALLAQLEAKNGAREINPFE